ncbi:MAG TPA: Ig-like domain-containing protein, partial [Thermoanaerobaculia bacterium]|nr:Ig-like domain-containing protein [Thermoanaerobaculia bacterium]
GTELGKGYVTGAVYDATTGRPLANATVAIRGGDVLHTNDRGRYSRALGEGAYTIEATADGYTTVWRQVVVPAGAGVVPIDIRLTRAGASQSPSGAALTLTHGGDTAVTGVAELTLAAAPVPPGRTVRLTAIGAQSLAGLLPLGWSPHAAAEVVVEGESATPGATLAFRVDAAAISAAQQTLSLVQYDFERDEWRVVRAVATIENNKATFDLAGPGQYALVYPDAAPHLAHPPVAREGAVLKGVANPCSDAPETCALTSRTFTLEPRAVLPNGRAVATLITEGATQTYPSGTAAQAYIDEQLNLADGRVLVDPPFAADLLVYRTLAGDAGVAAFHLAPTSTAAAVMLRDGVERVRIVDYPGRIDRGTLVGAEGGRVPGDDSVTLDVPTGATSEPLHARTTSIPASDVSTYGSIAGFRVAGGFALELTRANAPPSPDDSPLATPSLLLPARATFAVPQSALAGATTQAIVVEVLPQTAYGVAFQLVAIADAGDAVSGARLFTTRTVDSTALPIDGIVRDGRYLILIAESPIAFAYGQVRAGANGVVVPNARVSANTLGVTSITASAGVFVLPVRSAPAAPFSLVARTPATGDGAAATATAVPAAGAFVNFGALELVAQPPHLRSVSPDGGEVPVDAAFVVRAEFDTAIDPASVAGAIEVTNLTTQQRMAGTVSAAGAIVTFNPGEPLRAASEYSITIQPTIRALNGAPFGELVVKTFTTSARPRGSTAFNPDRIRITMPDANGRSTIRGTAGALPAGAQAVAVRRGRFFVEAYQATVASDGSFSFEAGRDARDRITIEDVIDLHVVDAVSHAVVAMIELTPFASDDARSFIARHDRETTFISADGFVVRVPAGAFERPTLVHVAPAQQAAFAEVPAFSNELDYGASVELTFDGVAKKRLQVSLPIPATLDAANRGWYLGYLGASSRGPRVMLVDVMHVAGGMFVSGPASTQNNIRNIRTHAAGSIQTNAALTGAEVSEYLLGMERSGIYAALDLRVPEATLAWGFLEGLQGSYDLFWDTLESLYSAHFYMVERGRVAIPIIAGKQFQVVGVDAATGLEAYTKIYDPVPIGDPGAAVTLPDPNPDRTGPYPVFATPFRVETFDLNVRNVDITTIRDFTIRLQNAQVKVTTTLAAEVAVALLNVTQGLVDPSRDGGLALDAAVGDRIVLVIAQADVDPYTPVSVVFDEPLHLPNGDAGLAALFTVETRSDEEAPYVAITEALRFSSDSGGRRVTVHLPASLTRGNSYRIGIKPEVRNATGLKIGQARDAKGVATGGLSEPLYLDFTVREPGGRVASFDLPEGVVRDQALNGNILIVSAGGGGVYAYDVSDPAAMVENSAPLPHKIPGYSTDYWAVTSDHHGRVYTTGMNALYGMVQSFRLEHFNKLPPPPDPDPNPDYEGIRPMGGAIVSWRPGAAAGMEITSRLLATDRAEAIPRRLQVLLQDSEVAYENREAFKAGASVSVEDVNGEFETLTATFARDFDAELEINPNRTYLIQRITVENITLDMRWSGDATVNGPAVIEGIVARKGDRLRVIRNQTTYGVVSLFGYGVAIYDLNAVESNDVLTKPAEYVLLREQIRMTNAKRATWCGPAIPDSIPDLEFTPDSLVTSQPGSSDLKVYALDVARGVLDLKVTPPAVSFDDDGNTVNAERVNACSERAPEGLIFRMRTFTPDPEDTTICRGYKHHPRLWAICNAYDVQLKRAPFGRFTGASFHRWTIEANDNRVVTPASGDQPALGQRGTRANTRAQRDYMLIPGNEYGLLVVEIPKNGWLAKSHLADVIWIPHGANAVRTIPRTNLATVVDGRGHVLLVDLSRIDERWDENGLTDQTKLFRTAASLLQNGFEKPDPRIVWISDTPLATGTLAPAIDPNTGFVYVGKILAKTTEVVAAIDPRLQIKVNTGSPTGLSEVGGIVPLGVDPPRGVLLVGDDASLAAFRLEVALPGGLDASLGGSFRLRVQNERVP